MVVPMWGLHPIMFLSVFPVPTQNYAKRVLATFIGQGIQPVLLFDFYWTGYLTRMVRI